MRLIDADELIVNGRKTFDKEKWQIKDVSNLFKPCPCCGKKVNAIATVRKIPAEQNIYNNCDRYLCRVRVECECIISLDIGAHYERQSNFAEAFDFITQEAVSRWNRRVTEGEKEE